MRSRAFKLLPFTPLAFGAQGSARDNIVPTVLSVVRRIGFSNMDAWVAVPELIWHALILGQPITLELVIIGLFPEDARAQVSCSGCTGARDKRLAEHDCLSWRAQCW